MSASFSFPFLLAQVSLQTLPKRLQVLMGWLYVFGEPTYTIQISSLTTMLIAGLLTWAKVVSLFCLLGWVLSWVSAALKERQQVARTTGRGLDIAAVAAIVGVGATLLVRVLETTGRLKVYKIGGVYTVNLMAIACGLVLFAWIENAVWTTIRRLGKKGDVAVMLGIHGALLLGLAVGFTMREAANRSAVGTTNPTVPVYEALVFGLRVGATYMGYVVLSRVLWLMLIELVSIRWRRLYAIARVSVLESNRRMWAPYVVVTVFLVVLAFTHWFLQPPRPAEVGRLYVGTLTLLISLLLTVMVTLLAPLSLPQDIQGQTIYTIVSKPVRRIELVWGRMLGFMTIVTVLTLIFGGVSLFYLRRTVGGTIEATDNAAAKALKSGRLSEARQLREQADQVRTRMAARVPNYGSLTFLDSKGTAHVRGIDVGTEQSMREPRSHIEGATPATAIWSYGLVPDPLAPPGVRPPLLDRRLPVASLLNPDSVEGLLNRTFDLQYRIAAGERGQSSGNAAAGEVKNLTASLVSYREELKRATDAYTAKKTRADDLEREAAEADKGNKPDDAAKLRSEAAKLHSSPVPMEMTFNVYRTTKGRVGEPVYAELEVRNPATNAEYRNIFAIREYYTNKQYVPASVLAGCNGSLRVEVRCISPTQYLGMAESDLFILSRSGDFGTNFMKGLFGIWLQALVLTAIGVFAGTFLSWPVALLTTISFFLAGQMAYAFLLDFTRQSLLGGGPFESLIRLVTHDNQMSDLTPTLSVVTAKTLDAIVMPVMSRLAYVVPNFSGLDVSNTVADGFAVTWTLLCVNLLMALAYALPFSIAGYFILKNREVAA